MTEETAPAVPPALVERVAQELVDDGYEAIVAPAPHLLPADIARFRPDILARRGGRTSRSRSVKSRMRRAARK